MRRHIVISIAFLASAVFAIEKNPFFSTEEDLEKWFWDSTEIGAEKRLIISIEDTTCGKEVWKIETRCFCKLDWSVYVLYDWNNDSIICGHGLIAGIDFGGEEFGEECIYNNKPDLQKEVKAKIALRYLIQKEFKDYLLQTHTSVISLAKQKEIKSLACFAKQAVDYPYWKYLPIDSTNVTQYNDLGFYLEQGGRYKEAVVLLTEVIKAIPTRTVAYLNLADAYWGLSDTTNASINYCKYIELMKRRNLEKKIPERALERCVIERR